MKVCVDYSKAQIIAEFQATKTLAKNLKSTKGIDLGVFVVNAGFVISKAGSTGKGTIVKNQDELLKSAGAPLSMETIPHHYILTVEGEPVCLTHLCIDLTNDSTTTATLIHQPDEKLSAKAQDITKDQLKKEADGTVNWLPFELTHTQGRSRLVYYRRMKVNRFTDEILTLVKEEKKQMIRIPHHITGNSRKV